MNTARIFRARNKITAAGIISHVTQRAPGAEPLFVENTDYLFMLSLLKKISKVFNLDIYCFVLMPNHIHLALRTSENNLSFAMKNLFEKYANYFNIKYKRKGHVFCGAYRQAVCLNENYLFSIAVYIHLNPLKAGIVNNLLEYPWSSIRPYISPVKTAGFLNHNFVLDLLNPDINKAREMYKNLLKEALSIDSKNIFENPYVMDTFTHSINNTIHNLFRTDISNIDIFCNDIFRQIEYFYNKKNLKNPQSIKARKYLIQQLISRGYKINDISKRLNISRQSISRNLAAC